MPATPPSRPGSRPGRRSCVAFVGAPTAVHVESRWSAEQEDGTARLVDAVRTAVEAAFRAVRAARQDARIPAAACERVATVAVAALQACRASSGVAASTVDEAVALHHHLAEVPEGVQSLAPRALPLRSALPVGARCVAASPADALPAQAGAQVAASYPAPRCEAGLSAERIVRAETPVALVRRAARRHVLRRRAPEVLRSSPRQPAVLRREALRERSRQEVLHQQQWEAVVQLRQRVAPRRRRPEPRWVPARRLAAVRPRTQQSALSSLRQARAA